MVSASAQSSVVERLFDPVGQDLPRDVARFFLGVNFTDSDLRRIAELSQKANEGGLNSQERQELSEYVLLNDFLVIMHSRAKRSLKQS